MPRARVELDRAGMRELLRSSEVSAEMRRRAQRVADAARSSAPVGPDSRTGEVGGYRDSIHVEVDRTGDRARARVVVSDWKAHILEAEHRVLGRALDAAKE